MTDKKSSSNQGFIAKTLGQNLAGANDIRKKTDNQHAPEKQDKKMEDRGASDDELEEGEL